MSLPASGRVAALVGDRLRAERGEMPMAELARRANLTVPGIWRIERGERTPSLPNLVILARALGCRVTDLVSPLDEEVMP